MANDEQVFIAQLKHDKKSFWKDMLEGFITHFRWHFFLSGLKRSHIHENQNVLRNEHIQCSFYGCIFKAVAQMVWVGQALLWHVNVKKNNFRAWQNQINDSR